MVSNERPWNAQDKARYLELDSMAPADLVKRCFESECKLGERDQEIARLTEIVDDATIRLDDRQKRLDEQGCRLDEMRVVNEGLVRALAARVGERDAALLRLRTLSIGIVGARMALTDNDLNEAYHLLYRAAATLSDDRLEPWKGVDALAAGAIERRDGQTFVNLPTDVERQTPK